MRELGPVTLLCLACAGCALKQEVGTRDFQKERKYTKDIPPNLATDLPYLSINF